MSNATQTDPASRTTGTATAMVLEGFGRAMAPRTFPRVDPDAGAVVVDVTHAGICGTDIHLQQGRLAIPVPVILGHEAVGRVHALGEGVTTDARGEELRVGDAVSWASNIPCGHCYYCEDQQEPSLCETRKVYGINQSSADWPHLSGGWSEQIYLQPGSTIVRIPSSVTPQQVIALGCAGPTAVHAVNRIAKPDAGNVVVVQGSGPVGLACAMYATLAGAAKVIIVGGPANRLEVARTAGIGDIHIDIFAETDRAARLDRILAETTGGRGADVVIEAAGVPTAVSEGIDIARRGGKYLVVGQYTDHGTTPINPHYITKKQLQVLGSWAFSPHNHLEYVESLPRLAARFDLASMVTEYPLGKAEEAMGDMRDGRSLKSVLVTGGQS
ncbi:MULTISPECIES: zinc-binding dehydrogenase [Rhodococcus]|jgi:threonine dehydrogenase-like Zn-dependent dehydrogenase|uniref:Threonine dehydrogenase n=2 Tax=Rhodococcus TaxID=1827 RepID=A0A1H4LLP5_9NOCA|nr:MULTISPECIES: zinc-binding dehydrogenase [Rhodococcus]AAR90167.1 putative alcohol dehydrogenase [Rhodococcus sp. DK17]ABG99200.1 probable alcohol dehydrogenase [Rhodococcus jostii RHA1]SEB71650.1 Threonine dehydrogenase [Rhodococcus koreensis]